MFKDLSRVLLYEYRKFNYFPFNKKIFQQYIYYENYYPVGGLYHFSIH